MKLSSTVTALTQFSGSDELCEYMSDLTGGVTMLAFSRGKDAVVAWLKLKRYFKTIIPYYMYLIPPRPMSFEEDSLKYFEDFFGQHIVRLPHPSLYRYFLESVFIDPPMVEVAGEMIKDGTLYPVTYEDNHAEIEQCLGYKDLYQASGVRMADSPMRRISVLKHGSVSHNKKSWLPVYDYVKEDMLRELRSAKVKLPIDYKWFGRTFDGIDYRFMSVLKEKSPKDFEQIKAAFPLVEADIMRMEYRRRHYENK